MQFAATLFDGRTAKAVDGILEVQGRSLRFRAGGAERLFGAADSRLVAPVGSGAWTVELADGASIRVPGDEAGSVLAAAYGQSSIVQRLEKSWPWAVTALVVAVVGSWAFLTYGVPVIARDVAFAIPDRIHQRLGADSMDILDGVAFRQSRVPEARREAVRQLFRSIPGIDNRANGYTLYFRSSPRLGANAFAIPGGLVVITDEMLDLMASDDEILGVLAHEVGHLEHRHGLRIILQDSLSALLIAALTGDLSNVSTLSATVPTVLMQAKYSRDFEREADEYAFAYLEANSLDTNALATLLERVERESRSGSVTGPAAWFSSHPPSSERTPATDAD